MRNIINPELSKIISDKGVAAALEAKRLSEKYQKDFFNCDDLAEVMNIGKHGAYNLFNSKGFPVIEIGNRKVVSILNFSLWLVEKNK